jgi:UDP-N-acetylmuramate dehydrogenase
MAIAIEGFEGRVTDGVNLAELTTLGVGGFAPSMLEPANADDVRRVLKSIDDVFVLGAGSNVLISDSGIGVPVLKMVNGLKNESNTQAGLLRVGAGHRLPVLVGAAAEAGLSGLEWAVGIPGTVGGALAVNAGAFGSEIWECVQSFGFVLRGGAAEIRTPAEITLGYRYTDFGVGEPFVITEVNFVLGVGDRGNIRDLIREYSEKRKKTQPVHKRSAGSFFKNPPGGPPAGRLIDEAGLKGARCGGAAVSDVHANFIINEGSAAADEVYTVAEFVRRTVANRVGIELEYEVELVGDFNYLGDDRVESGRI